MKSGFCTFADWLLIFALRSYVWSADRCFVSKIGDIIHLKRKLHFLQQLCFSLFPICCDCYRNLKMALRFSISAVKGIFSLEIRHLFSILSQISSMVFKFRMHAFFGFQRPDMGYQQSLQRTLCQSSKLLRGEQGVEKVDNMNSYWAESIILTGSNL